MIKPMQYNRFGYKFLSWIGDGYHPGVDLNWWRDVRGSAYDDLGLPVVAIAGGKVVYASMTGSGWGNLVVIYHPAFKVWSRYAHLNKIEVGIGQLVSEGQEIGTCGRTGTKSPHLHFDILKKELKSWSNYVHGWPKAKVLEYYVDPLKFIEDNGGVPPVVPDWARKAWEKAEAKGLQLLDPLQEVDPAILQMILKDADVIKEVGKLPFYRMLVVLDKMRTL